MYRIELSPGEETALWSIEELAIGIRNGVITPRARIWHQAGQKWLPIELHPHYRLALNHQAAQAAAAEAAAVPAALPAAFAAPAAVEKPKAASEPEAAPPPVRALRSGRRPIRLALIGGVLALGTHVVLSATVSSGDAGSEPASMSRPVPPAATPVLRAGDAATPAHASAAGTAASAVRTRTLPATATRSASRPASPAPAAPRSPAKPLVGGVVRGPGLVAPPPLPAAPVKPASPPDSVPAIAPAPTGVHLEVPKHLSADSLGLPSKVAIDSAAPSGISRVLNAIAPKR